MPKNSTYVHYTFAPCLGASVGNQVKSDAYIDTPSNESPGLSTARCCMDDRHHSRPSSSHPIACVINDKT